MPEERIDNQYYDPEDLERLKNKDKPTLTEDIKNDEEKHTGHTPLTINDSGPEELKNTLTKPENNFNVIGNNGIDQYEVCPNQECDEVLHLYSTKDIITGKKIYRCRNCHQEVVKSNRGWVKPEQ